ncbi:hypothetical protein J1N35_019323 [Gossypium stocksii]|uniref:Uncharacterized protein n=1 Tax=Gossypium stocksii TaxID=47602 RepID=A0A9D4A812_9ROSI|nr:hypothetical protein J1N35_019323 [Gossypium stocksii]
MSHFFANKTLQQPPTYFITIHDGTSESLRDYVCKFNVATMITKGVIDEWAIQAFIIETTHQYLIYIYIGNTPSKLLILHEMVHKLLKGDEVRNVHVDSSAPITR